MTRKDGVRLNGARAVGKRVDSERVKGVSFPHENNDKHPN
jgi:hypothetical protein